VKHGRLNNEITEHIDEMRHEINRDLFGEEEEEIKF
jgi:hypothetical protein